MNLISYTITQIDEVKGLLYVTFNFDTEAKEKRFDYRAKTAFDKLEMRPVDIKYKGFLGKTQTKTEMRAFMTMESRPLFNLSDPIELDKALKDWAAAYIRGKEEELNSNQKVSEAVVDLVGVTNTVGGTK